MSTSIEKVETGSSAVTFTGLAASLAKTRRPGSPPAAVRRAFPARAWRPIRPDHTGRHIVNSAAPLSIGGGPVIIGSSAGRRSRPGRFRLRPVRPDRPGNRVPRLAAASVPSPAAAVTVAQDRSALASVQRRGDVRGQGRPARSPAHDHSAAQSCPGWWWPAGPARSEEGPHGLQSFPQWAPRLRGPRQRTPAGRRSLESRSKFLPGPRQRQRLASLPGAGSASPLIAACSRSRSSVIPASRLCSAMRPQAFRTSLIRQLTVPSEMPRTWPAAACDISSPRTSATVSRRSSDNLKSAAVSHSFSVCLCCASSRKSTSTLPPVSRRPGLRRLASQLITRAAFRVTRYSQVENRASPRKSGDLARQGQAGLLRQISASARLPRMRKARR